MSDNATRLITVAIHTYDRALALKNTLEREGLSVTLQNVNLSNPVVSAGVRVRIHENDLPLALRIIENPEIFPHETVDNKEKTPVILMPIDFSHYSEHAALIAFQLADRHKASIHLLHSYMDPMYTNRVQLSDVLSFDEQSSDIDNRQMIMNEANRQMELFCAGLISKIKEGLLPAVRFTSEIVEGLPEESINQYARTHAPLMIVMGTRGAETKEREVVGSVTAEVLDTCRTPIFTVPESIDVASVAALKSVIFFSNFDQEDILALDLLFRMMPYNSLNVTLVKLPGKKYDNASAEYALTRLGEYCRKHYPQHHFFIDNLSVSAIDEDFSRIASSNENNLIAVPNKKKNIIARLFNPGIAHKILFHSDIPMIVLPV